MIHIIIEANAEAENRDVVRQGESPSDQPSVTRIAHSVSDSTRIQEITTFEQQSIETGEGVQRFPLL